MTQNIIFPVKREDANWYISFLQEKEENLVAQTGFKRVKTQKKVFFSEQGRIVYNFVYVKPEKGICFSPLREYLGIGRFQNMSPDFKNKLVMKASRTTYQKAVEDVNDSFSFCISKKTLNRYVISTAGNLEITKEKDDGQNILLADSTKVRDGKGAHHEVMAVMSLDYETNSSSLAGFGINTQPKKLAEAVELESYKAFVGDADLGLRNFFKDKIPFQLCHQHAITDISFFLWKEGVSKKERGSLMKKFKSVLYTLQNSTKKYWRSKKTGRLVNRIIKTRRNLRSLAVEFSSRGMHESARYLMYHKEHLVTAAKLALLGTKVPWTTNHAERLMQEIGTRTKKKGMNWTEKGLRAVLNLVLKRYFLPKERRNYKEVMMQMNKVVVEI